MKTFIWEIAQKTGINTTDLGGGLIKTEITHGPVYQKTEVENWGDTCSVQEAQEYIDKKYPGNIVVNVYEKV